MTDFRLSGRLPLAQYGIVFSGSDHGANWGDFGSPEVHHYNSDVRVQMQHSGVRVNDSYVRYRPGNYSVLWHGETLISGLDFVYIPGLPDNPATDKAQREAAEEVVEQSVKQAAKEAVERGSREFAKKTAKETMKEFVEDVAKEVAEETIEEAVFAMLDSCHSLGAPHRPDLRVHGRDGDDLAQKGQDVVAVFFDFLVYGGHVNCGHGFSLSSFCHR